MYQHRMIHVLGDDDNGIQLADQLAEFAELMDSDVAVLAHINSRIFQLSSPDKEALNETKAKVEELLTFLESKKVITSANELTMQNIVDASRLYAEARGADCISLMVTEAGGRLSGNKKKIATSALQNVLLLRESGELPPKTVICPIDGSPASAKGLRQALMFAFAWDAKLQLISILGTPRLFASPTFGIDYPVSYGEIEAHVEKEKELIGGFIERHVPDINEISVEYRSGAAASSGILNFLSEDPRAFLVMGVAARDRFSSAVLGNSSYQVATRAANSTFLVRNNSY